MRAQRTTTDFRRVGVLIAVVWTAPSVTSLIASLYGGLISNSTDELDLVLAIVGALGMGFAVGSYAVASALEKIATGLSLVVAEQLTGSATGRLIK